jgi:hypothetical protein
VFATPDRWLRSSLVVLVKHLILILKVSSYCRDRRMDLHAPGDVCFNLTRRSLVGLNNLVGLISGMEEAACLAKPSYYRSRPCARREAMISAWFNLAQKSISQSQNTELSRPCGAVRSRSHDFLNGGCTIRLSQGFSNIVKMYKRNLHPRLTL